MITPIIMESNIENVKQKLDILRERKLNQVHIDIGDGLFSDLLSISPADLQEVELSSIKLDLHLLVDDPTEYVEECVALSPTRIIAQIERMGSQVRYLETIESYGGVGGLALRIETPIEEIEIDALNMAKAIILLAVPAGTSGSSFDKRVLPKIEALRKIYAGSIIVDGGINQETYEKVISAGATEVGANSSYWKGLFDHGQA